jgi:uncharacterized protein
MPYIIDGHNLIPKIMGLDLAAADDELQLIEKLQVFCLKEGKKAEVFFDNAPIGRTGPIKRGLVTARFVRAGSTADHAIHRRLAEIGPEAKNYWVVSSDFRVQQSAREFHARPIPSEEFAKRMEDAAQGSSGPEKDPGAALNADDIKEWIRIFKKKSG